MILSKLGIHGFSKSQETSILASMLCGEPCLLIGPPGTAKTELVNAIGAALREDSRVLNPNNPDKWFSYQVYDASKINFEDLFGYPDINGLKCDPPVVRYISTPSSIWGKDLIAFDELNRCAEDRQSNLFEIIRSRKLHGTPTGNTLIFSTMNPFGDQGTIEMSDALVDRHLFYLRLGSFHNFDSTNRKLIIKRVGQVDGIGFRYWGDVKEEFDINDKEPNKKLAAIGAEIRALFTQAMEHHKSITSSMGDNFTTLIDKIVDQFHFSFLKESPTVQKECSISGRRASSILRGLIATRAIQYALNSLYNEPIEPITTTLVNTIKTALPIGIGGKISSDLADKADFLVQETVRLYWDSIVENTNAIDIDKIQHCLSVKNPIVIIDTLLSVSLNTVTKTTLINLLLDKNTYIDKNPKSNTFNTIDYSMYNLISIILDRFLKVIPSFKNDFTQSFEINIDPSTQESLRQHATVSNISKYFNPYIDIINSMIEESSNDPLHSVCIMAAIKYYKDIVNSDIEAIKAIGDIKSFSFSLKNSLPGNSLDSKSNI